MAESTAPSATANNTLPAAHTSIAHDLLSAARSEQVERKKGLDSWGTGKIVTGIAMMAGAVVWFFGGLLAGVIFFYPPVMFVLGLVALINGIAQKVSR